jgi:regulatory protein
MLVAVFFWDTTVGRLITALEIQQNNQERVNVYLDGEFAFGLPAIDAARLRKGQQLSDDEIATLRQTDEIARAFERVVRLLARRPYSTAEVRRYLEKHTTAVPIIEEVLTRLAQLGYIDDRAFATYWVENRERFRPRGPQALQHELRQKGIPNDIITEVLESVDRSDSAYRAAQERVRRLHGLSLQEFKTKLGTFLLRRGFGYDIVREVVDRLIHELQEEQPDFFATDEEL